MADLIKGIPVILHQRVQTGEDALHSPVYAEVTVMVHNVLVSPATSTELLSEVSLEGKKSVYEICIPKTDTHSWEDCRLEFFGRSYKTFGPEKEYISANTPGAWNRKILAARYE